LKIKEKNAKTNKICINLCRVYIYEKNKLILK